MSWSDRIERSNRELAALRRETKETAAAMGQLGVAAMAEGALEPRTKELMAVAISVAKRCEDCIAFHVRGALRHGATREQLVETVATAAYMGGGPAMIYGAKALAAYDELNGG